LAEVEKNPKETDCPMGSPFGKVVDGRYPTKANWGVGKINGHEIVLPSLL
jgi:hypothetical protein